MKLSRKKIISFAAVGVPVVILVWVAFTLFNTSSFFFKPTPPPLRVAPDKIVHSVSYRNSYGEEEVKYAYITKEVPVDTQMGEDISLRTSNSKTKIIKEVTSPTGEKRELRETTFYDSPQFYPSNGSWQQIEYATTTPEVLQKSGAVAQIEARTLIERMAQFAFGVQPAFASVSTFYPDANTETTSVDGYADYVTGGSTWAATVSGAGTAANDTSTLICQSSYSSSYTIRSIYRVFSLFDTSTLPDSATISAATLSYYINSKSDGDDDGTDTLNIVTVTPASNTAIVTADYAQVGSTLQASAIDITGVTTGAYLDFTLNGTGIGNISLTGITKFGMLEGHDLGNSEINVNTTNSVTATSSESTGTSQDPKLVVTYTTDTTAPTPNPATFATNPYNPAEGFIIMVATTGSDAGGSTPIEYLSTEGAGSCGANHGTGGGTIGWQTGTTFMAVSLQTNKCYSYTVQMRDSLGNTGTASSPAQTYTSANVPGAPTFSSVTPTTANISNAENGNPASNPTTNFAVLVNATDPIDSTWNGKYVNGSGAPSASAVWLTDAQIDALTITGLKNLTTYTVAVKARNQDTDETSFSANGIFSTTYTESSNKVRLLKGTRLIKGVRLY